MNSLTSKGIIFDTNVLSLFAKINRLDLLEQLLATSFATIPLYITPTIHYELKIGFQNGVEYLEDILQFVQTGHLQIILLEKDDKLFMTNLPAKLAIGEAEAIALCHRLNLVFISHDRKAINYCKRAGINYIRLATLLVKFQNAGLLTTSEMLENVSLNSPHLQITFPSLNRMFLNIPFNFNPAGNPFRARPLNCH